MEERSPLIEGMAGSQEGGEPLAESEAESTRRYIPWCLSLLPSCLFGTPMLTRRQWRALFLVGIASLFRSYDSVVLTVCLEEIQKDLAISEGNISFVTSFIQAGAVLSMGVGLFADRFGRKSALLLTIAPFSFFTFGTAFAHTIYMFAGMQFFARIFCQAEFMVAQVVITEEFDATNRGWGIGALGALGAAGAGLGLLMYGVLGGMESKWRIMYGISVLPMLWIIHARRNLQETERFQEVHEARGDESVFTPLSRLLREYPSRFWACVFVSFALAVGTNAGTFFAFKYMEEEFKYSTSLIAMLGLVIGGLSLVTYLIAGTLSDKYGRKRLTLLFLFVASLANVAFYNLPKSVDYLLPFVWFVKVSDGMAISVLYGTFATELFPTAFRSTARGAVLSALVIGDTMSLISEGVLYNSIQNHWHAISILSISQLAALPIIAFVFPETSGKQLEDIAPDQTPASPHRKPLVVD
eukprot:c26861_g1_i1.p1 GENE.c26861_g1_i1~~c26861_g1_i1.p1  ORF type:complete len:477 (-),score=83.71 c26861_g1_i1:257-1663(-)